MADNAINMPMAPETDPEDLAVNPQALMTVGEVMRLASNSSFHREYTLGQLEDRFVVPIAYDQIRVYRSEIEPLAVVTWALLSDELHEKMKAERFDLNSDDWRSGDNLWLIEAIIAPEVSDMVQQDLMNTVFPNKIGHMWVRDENDTWNVETYYGANRQGSAAAGVH